MIPRNYNKKLTTVICDNCGKEFLRAETEVKRILAKGRHMYCSKKCTCEGLSKVRKELPYKPASEKMLEHLKHICGNQRDEYTPFRYTYRCVKRRFKEVDITMDDLKAVWETQKGICPYTGFKLILPESSNVNEIDFFHRASLDRIDSSLGYVKGNIQFISTPINLMKSTKTDSEVKKFLKEISSYTSNFLITE